MLCFIRHCILFMYNEYVHADHADRDSPVVQYSRVFKEGLECLVGFIAHLHEYSTSHLPCQRMHALTRCLNIELDVILSLERRTWLDSKNQNHSPSQKSARKLIVHLTRLYYEYPYAREYLEIFEDDSLLYPWKENAVLPTIASDLRYRSRIILY